RRNTRPSGTCARTTPRASGSSRRADSPALGRAPSHRVRDRHGTWLLPGGPDAPGSAAGASLQRRPVTRATRLADAVQPVISPGPTRSPGLAYTKTIHVTMQVTSQVASKDSSQGLAPNARHEQQLPEP